MCTICRSSVPPRVITPPGGSKDYLIYPPRRIVKGVLVNSGLPGRSGGGPEETPELGLEVTDAEVVGDGYEARLPDLVAVIQCNAGTCQVHSLADTCCIVQQPPSSIENLPGTIFQLREKMQLTLKSLLVLKTFCAYPYPIPYSLAPHPRQASFAHASCRVKVAGDPFQHLRNQVLPIYYRIKLSCCSVYKNQKFGPDFQPLPVPVGPYLVLLEHRADANDVLCPKGIPDILQQPLLDLAGAAC